MAPYNYNRLHLYGDWVHNSITVSTCNVTGRKSYHTTVYCNMCIKVRQLRVSSGLSPDGRKLGYPQVRQSQCNIIAEGITLFIPRDRPNVKHYCLTTANTSACAGAAIAPLLSRRARVRRWQSAQNHFASQSHLGPI